MFEVVGKAYYKVKFEDKIYSKIRFTLQIEKDDVDEKFDSYEGVFCDTVCVKDDSYNSIPQIGDFVRVSYNRYGKPDAVIVVK